MWEHVEEWQRTKQASLERRVALKPMRFDECVPIWLAITIWRKKPWERYLLKDAGGKCECTGDPQGCPTTDVSECWGLHRPRVVVPWRTVFVMEE